MTIQDAISRPREIGERAGTDDSLEFSGRFGFGIDQWACVPFDVPTGVRRISVQASHDRFSLFGVARNVLDMGIFGPAGHDLGNTAGFRGWSGGARDGFTLSAADATPGYLAGPIDPGRWALALGPVVLNPLGMRWWARVSLEHGAAPSDWGSVAVQPAITSRRGAGWYRGDMHLHTVHSDGQYEPREMLAVADAAGLDFIVSTEHNTSSANRSWAACPGTKPLVIAGEEVTTRHGHWLAVGLPPDEWVDWRYAPRDGVFPEFAAQVKAGGGVVVAAHPAVPLPGSAWEFGYRDVDAIEVWNGKWNLDDEVSLRIWNRLLRQGNRVAAVGGSDSHGPHQRIGTPQTVVYARELRTPAVLDALRHGRSYVAESSAVTTSLTATCPDVDVDLVAGPGGTLFQEPGTPVSIEATVSGAPNARIAIITAAGRAAWAGVDPSGTGRIRLTTNGDEAGFARVEVRRPTRGGLSSMVAMTNPVWLAAHRQGSVTPRTIAARPRARPPRRAPPLAWCTAQCG
jgi:predicted metal-dependent phosphoesterase TrpH